MKIYVATAFGNKAEAQELMKILRALQHEITHDWTNETLDPSLSKEQQTEFLYKCGEADARGVFAADLLVLINHPECNDAKTEFGMAIGAGKPVVVLHPGRRGSVFFGHVLVTLCESLDEVLGAITLEESRTWCISKERRDRIGAIVNKIGQPPPTKVPRCPCRTGCKAWDCDRL